MFRNVKLQQRPPDIHTGYLQTRRQNFGYGQRGKLENVDLKANMSERALVSSVFIAKQADL